MREMGPACVVLPTEKESSGKNEGSETDKEGEGRKGGSEGTGKGGREEQLLMGCIDLEIAVSLSFAIALSLLCLATTLLRSSICSTRGAADVERHLDARLFLTRRNSLFRTLAEQISKSRSPTAFPSLRRQPALFPRLTFENSWRENGWLRAGPFVSHHRRLHLNRKDPT